MIKITKPARAPAVLRTRGVRRRDAHIRSYEGGRREFSADFRIYGDPSVKQALIAAQHGKCCFCERAVGEDGDVEHFRPKRGVCQGEGLPVETPGYYWLAYDWGNLFLACHVCNQRHKKSLFPLADPAQRARSHRDDVGRERPLFIDPSLIDPQEHIAFRAEVPYAVGGSPRGEATIAGLGLRKQARLSEERRERLARLQELQDIVNLEATYATTAAGRQLVERAREFLRKSVLDGAPFASMARAAAREDFRAPIL